MFGNLNSKVKVFLLFKVFVLNENLIAAGSYQQFMDVFHKDLFDEKRECLFGEFISDEHPYEVEESPLKDHFIVRFLIKFKLKGINTKIKAYRTITSGVRKYTQNCFVEFHHLNSYETEFSTKVRKRPEIDNYSGDSFAFIRLLEYTNWQNFDNASGVVGSLRLLSPPTFVVTFFKYDTEDRIMRRTVLNLIYGIFSQMEYYGTRHALWFSGTLSEYCFYCSYKLTKLTDVYEKAYLKQIKAIVFSKTTFPNLRRISLQKETTVYSFWHYQKSDMLHCKSKDQGKSEFTAFVLPCLYGILEDHLNFTFKNTMDESILPTPSVSFQYNTMHNQKFWYQAKEHPSNEREVYCSHNLIDYKLKVFVRKDRQSVSFLEALQLPFCVLTWALIIVMSLLGTCTVILTIKLDQARIVTGIPNANVISCPEISVFFFTVWIAQGYANITRYMRRNNGFLGYGVIIFVLLGSVIANLYSGVVSSFFTVRRLPVIPKNLMQTTDNAFAKFVLITDFSPNSDLQLSFFHRQVLQTFVEQVDEMQGSYHGSYRKSHYQTLMDKIAVTSPDYVDFDSVLCDIVNKAEVKVIRYNDSKVVKNVSLGDSFAIVRGRSFISIADIFINSFARFETFPDSQYYTNYIDGGNLEVLVLNHGKYLKLHFHSLLAWIDNSGIYSRMTELESEFKCSLILFHSINRQVYVAIELSMSSYSGIGWICHTVVGSFMKGDKGITRIPMCVLPTYVLLTVRTPS